MLEVLSKATEIAITAAPENINNLTLFTSYLQLSLQLTANVVKVQNQLIYSAKTHSAVMVLSCLNIVLTYISFIIKVLCSQVIQSLEKRKKMMKKMPEKFFL